MEIIHQYHQPAAIFTARIFLGVLFFIQGYDAVFKIKLKNAVITYHQTFKEKGIPLVLTGLAAWFTSCTAMVCGVLLILGLFEYIALYLLAINLIVTAVGFSISKPLWDMRFAFPRLLLILFLLLTPVHWNEWSLDHVLLRVY